jgi:hypothetical protein
MLTFTFTFNCHPGKTHDSFRFLSMYALRHVHVNLPSKVRAATNQDTSSTSQRFVTVQQSRVPIVDSRDRGRPSNADYDPRNLRNLQCPDRVPGCSGNRIHVYRRLHLVRSVEGVEAAGPHRGQHRPVTLSLLSSNTFQGHIRALTVMGATYTYQITHDHRLRGARHGTAPDASHLTRL